MANPTQWPPELLYVLVENSQPILGFKDGMKLRSLLVNSKAPATSK
jgi:hypothetical protein